MDGSRLLPDYLVRGGRLDLIDAWAATTTIGLRPAERRFLDASRDLRADEQRVRQEEERRTTAAERRARRRTRQLALAAAAIAAIAALATFAWAQRQDARRAQADLTANQAGQRLAALSVNFLSSDPELALLLAKEAASATADRGYALPEAIDAMQWALQELGVQYDVTPATPTAARFGPGGVRGVWTLPLADLTSLADSAVARDLTVDECRRYVGPSGCRAPESMARIEYLGGTDAYADAVALDQAVVDVAIPGNHDRDEWQQNLDALGEQYGVRIRAQQIPGDLTAAEAATEGLPGDIFVIPPSQLPEFADAHSLLDLRPFVDETTMLDDFGTHLVSRSRIGDNGEWPSDNGAVHGVVVTPQSKSLVWTNEPEFTELGYERPSDWASFMNLAHDMVADSRPPFCLGLESGGANGWPATDWVETVVLRTAGPDFYDQWINHQVRFDDPRVVNAIRTVGEMVHTPGFLDTSPADAADRLYLIALDAFASNQTVPNGPPLEYDDGCLMTPFGSILPGQIGNAPQPVGTFAFPTFGRGHDDAVVGSGDIAIAITDRPEVRQAMAALASPDFGAASARLDWPSILPSNARFDVSTMVNPEVAAIVSGLQAAIRSESFRVDASDAMPPEIGADAFWDGMMRLFRDGSLENLDELSFDIAHDIEAAWVELEAGAG